MIVARVLWTEWKHDPELFIGYWVQDFIKIYEKNTKRTYLSGSVKYRLHSVREHWEKIYYNNMEYNRNHTSQSFLPNTSINIEHFSQNIKPIHLLNPCIDEKYLSSCKSFDHPLMSNILLSLFFPDKEVLKALSTKSSSFFFLIHIFASKTFSTFSLSPNV